MYIYIKQVVRVVLINTTNCCTPSVFFCVFFSLCRQPSSASGQQDVFPSAKVAVNVGNIRELI